MTADRLYYCGHPGCAFRHTSLATMAEHYRDEHTKPVATQPEPEDM